MKTIPIIIAFIALISACGSSGKKALQTYETEVSYKESSIRYYDNGAIKKLKLTEPTQIGDYSCIRWVHFFENGNIKMMQTAEEIVWKQHHIPARSFIFFNRDEPDYIEQVWLSNDTQIQGINCSGRGKVTTTFYPNGELKSCFVDHNRYVQGYPCMGGMFENLQFHKDGKLKSFTISKDTNYRNTKIPKGTRILIQPGKNLQLIEG